MEFQQFHFLWVQKGIIRQLRAFKANCSLNPEKPTSCIERGEFQEHFQRLQNSSPLSLRRFQRVKVSEPSRAFALPNKNILCTLLFIWAKVSYVFLLLIISLRSLACRSQATRKMLEDEKSYFLTSETLKTFLLMFEHLNL